MVIDSGVACEAAWLVNQLSGWHVGWGRGSKAA